MMRSAEVRLERKADGGSRIADTTGLAHHSEASIDARTAAIMEEAERQLAKEQRDENNDIPRHSEAAKVQSIVDRSAQHPPGQRPLAAQKLAKKVAAGETS